MWSGDKSGMTLRSFERRVRWLAGSPHLYSKSQSCGIVGDVLSRLTTPRSCIWKRQRTRMRRGLTLHGTTYMA